MRYSVAFILLIIGYANIYLFVKSTSPQSILATPLILIKLPVDKQNADSVFRSDAWLWLGEADREQGI